MSDRPDVAEQGAIEPTVSDRGFKHYEPVSSRYGGDVRVCESSLATGPHIWLRSTAPVNLNDPDGPQVEAPMHLTLEGAIVLRDQLTHLIENHYQRPRRPGVMGDLCGCPLGDGARHYWHPTACPPEVLADQDGDDDA